MSHSSSDMLASPPQVPASTTPRKTNNKRPDLRCNLQYQRRKTLAPPAETEKESHLVCSDRAHALHVDVEHTDFALRSNRHHSLPRRPIQVPVHFCVLDEFPRRDSSLHRLGKRKSRQLWSSRSRDVQPVSYTHLTLPTICSV
eukprot:1325291-Rhodomonas_salina.1